jgi:hypothetical protein
LTHILIFFTFPVLAVKPVPPPPKPAARVKPNLLNTRNNNADNLSYTPYVNGPVVNDVSTLTTSQTGDAGDMYAVVNKPKMEKEKESPTNAPTSHNINMNLGNEEYAVVNKRKNLATKPLPPPKPVSTNLSDVRVSFKNKGNKEDEDDDEEDVEEVEELDVDEEAEKNYDVTSQREKVYYNDEIYVSCAEGAELKLDALQQKILDKLRGDIIDEEFQVLVCIFFLLQA